MTLTGLLLVALSALLLVPTGVLLAQVLAALPARRPSSLPTINRPSVVVLVPAHNEALGIAATLGSISAQLKTGDRLLVVADNCTDATAHVATAAGAEVIERHDRDRRGKGHALDFGVRHIERGICAQTPAPAVLVVVDADCYAAPGAIDHMAGMCALSGRPVQATYLMRAPDSSAGLTSAIAEFAWLVKNLVRPLGAARMGLPCQLMGSGMAFPWPAVRRMPLANSHLVEDMLLGFDFAKAGKPPLFCADALVTSRFPTSAAGVDSQRMRWEHGHLGMILGRAPGLLWTGLRQRRPALVAMALDACVPPLALLAMGVLAGVACCVAYGLTTRSVAAMIVSGAAAIMLGAAVLLSWLRFGRALVPAASFLLIGIYMLRKLPLYMRFLVRRQVAWVRARRRDE